jgi:hypothetical protein
MVLNGCDISVLLNERERRNWATEVSYRMKTACRQNCMSTKLRVHKTACPHNLVSTSPRVHKTIAGKREELTV